MSQPTNTSAFVPTGSTVTFNEDGSMNVVPPSGWMYIGFNTGGSYHEEALNAGICISCDCESGTGGCSPFLVSDTMGGCAPTGGCTLCCMTVSGITSGFEYASGGFINTSAIAAIINQSDTIPAPFSAMNDSTLVQSTITSYINSIYGGGTPPSVPVVDGVMTAPAGYTLAFVNILGRAVIIPVPNADFDEAVDAGGATASCSCNSGTCTLQSGPPVQCSSDCGGTCTLCSSAGGSITYSANCYLC